MMMPAEVTNTFCFLCFQTVSPHEQSAHVADCAQRREKAEQGRLFLKPRSSSSSSSSSSSTAAPLMVAGGLCTFQTPVRTETCPQCDGQVCSTEMGPHLFECTARSPAVAALSSDRKSTRLNSSHSSISY